MSEAMQTNELRYADRQELAEGEQATLCYKNQYSGSVVEKTVTVTGTSGSVTVETKRGSEWGIFGSSIRTSVDSRRQSDTVAAKNGRTLGYLVRINQ